MNVKEIDPLVHARVRLLSDDTKPSNAFLATGAMHLRIVVTEGVPTAAVDGTNLYYNPAFVSKLTPKQRKTLIAHEVLHCMFLHMFRVGSRDMELWNLACDYVINCLLVDWGFEPIPGWYFDTQYRGMAAETVYAKLYNLRKSSSSGGKGTTDQSTADGPEAPQPSKTGTMAECPTGQFTKPMQQTGQEEGAGSPQQVKPLQADDWATITEQAVLVSKAGDAPGGLDGLIKESRKPVTDWREELRQFVRQEIPSHESWNRPNRRFVGAGMYLPGPVKENLGALIVVNDSSGSTQSYQGVFAAQVQSIAQEVRPSLVVVVNCDTCVRSVEQFLPDEKFEFRMVGGGGTRFQPALDWIEENVDELNPFAAIYFTDLENGSERLAEPSIPMIWAAPKGTRLRQPFGNLVEVDVV